MIKITKINIPDCYINNVSKRLMKCSECGNPFFTQKSTLSSSDIKSKKTNLTTDLKRFQSYLMNLELQRDRLDSKIKKAKEDIRQINKEIKSLDVTVQCSKCGKRIDPVECEVRT